MIIREKNDVFIHRDHTDDGVEMTFSSRHSVMLQAGRTTLFFISDDAAGALEWVEWFEHQCRLLRDQLAPDPKADGADAR